MTEGTLDWDAYWSNPTEEERERASPSAHHAAETLCAFIADAAPPGPIADVGCGDGATAFAVAERFPEREVVGFDTAESVLADSRARAAEAELENLSFEQATLPAFDPAEEFAVVFSYFTLQYVRAVESALDSLYGAVASDGVLLFNYMNRAAREFCQVAAEDPHAHADRPFVFDPDRYRERFAALLDGDSVLSRERIYETLGVWPREVFTVVDAPDVRWAWHHAPLVYVPKTTA